MTYFCEDLTDLLNILKSEGDKVLDANSKLSLSSSLLYKINSTLSCFSKSKMKLGPSKTEDVSTSTSTKSNIDLQFLYDVMQKTIALKIVPDYLPIVEPYNRIELQLFESLRYLEINRFSISLVQGLKRIRSHLEYLSCIRSINSLHDILQSCGADKAQGFSWNQLKNAVFCHNYLSSVDSSLEFTPKLEVLDLSHNNISDAKYINCLPNLGTLNLSYNKLENLPTFSRSFSTNMRCLNLGNNFIEDIKELTILVNLEELDLGYNCLFNHQSLGPLSCLPHLKWLNLNGNPLSFHSAHRLFTLHYLHQGITPSKFILDYNALSSSEMKILGSLVEPSLPRSCSLNSEVTDTTEVSTVIETRKRSHSANDEISDLSSESSDSISIASTSSNEPIESNIARPRIQQLSVIEDTVINMQDSGFFAGTRPISPSQSSIGSATSLCAYQSKNADYESDIEVITNPSQSSIEVLDHNSQDTSTSRFSGR